ncbi:spore germination protein [Paenibacillus aurantius]|uniref:Spore germination protein n=1 Tax=Paenibacillus aurantius TaxID=2918900 RepID=A0AA96RJ35_9BACL|nr:spore germination protein [Paenibacillus aurantius]WNQ12824.1 spore germination protein [Paenibacillus aurantius]
MKANSSIETNKHELLKLFSNSSDFNTSDIKSGQSSFRLFYLKTMVDDKVVQEHVIRPLLRYKDVPVRDAVSVLDYQETDLLTDAAKALVEGKTVVQIHGKATFYLLDTSLNKERSLNIPVNERVLRGSQEGLIENLQTNLNLMRKLVATPDLVVKSYVVGVKSNTNVTVLYMGSLANQDILKEFDKRIRSINIDYVEAPGFLQELIQDQRFSLFPQILVTERPDRVRSYLMDGKIAILTDGSPDCLIVPVSFWAFFQSPDDYQIGWILGSMFRLLRIICFIMAISLPGAYVALVTFDPRILPYEIALTLQSSMQYIAMPPVLEAVTMLVVLEILREAAVRLASPIGQTIGIVGGIVIGTVVVQSNLISNMMVFVVAFTGVASYIIPSYEMSSSARQLSYAFIALAAIFGLIGLEFAFLLTLAHLARLQTMGIPYFYPALGSAPIKDTFLRAPIWSLTKRSKESLAQDNTRLKDPRGWTE